jgi:NTE family protein
MRAIEEQRLSVNRLVGVSMGSLIAGLCATEDDPIQARCRAMDFFRSRTGKKLRTLVASHPGLASHKSGLRFGTTLFRELKKQTALARAMRSQSLLPSKILRQLIDALVPDIDIVDLPIPLQIATVDLRSGQRVVLESGSLRRAIRASMSIPGIFPAVHHDGMLLSDIGVYNSVPCDIPTHIPAAKCGAEGIIAIDVGQQEDEQAACHTALDCFMRFQSLAEQTIRRQSLTLADFVVRPDFPRTEWFDFSDPDPIIQAGFDAAAKLFADPDPLGGAHIVPTANISATPDVSLGLARG